MPYPRIDLAGYQIRAIDSKRRLRLPNDVYEAELDRMLYLLELHVHGRILQETRELNEGQEVSNISDILSEFAAGAASIEAAASSQLRRFYYLEEGPGIRLYNPVDWFLGKRSIEAVKEAKPFYYIEADSERRLLLPVSFAGYAQVKIIGSIDNYILIP